MDISGNKTTVEQDHIRNIAIIAHVDHGKTTLVDAFLKQTHVFRANEEKMKEELILDFGELEHEKGITITAKNVSIRYKDYKINIIDTPGHNDFGGEVERTLNMADGCLLLVDAAEGPQPQTKFVLKKALELGLKIIVVVNKIDKKLANPQKTLDSINDLFLSLATDTTHLDFPVFYAIGRAGKVFTTLPKNPVSEAGDIVPLLEGIILFIPAPKGNPKSPFQLQICSIENDVNLGKFLIGKVHNGSAKIGDSIIVCESESNKKIQSGKIKKLYVKEGLKFAGVETVSCGEIAAVVGIDSDIIGATICTVDSPKALPPIKISPPAIKIKFEANTSPLLGKEGKFVTAKQLQQRLESEARTNITLKIKKGEGGYFVSGRGELQLAILIERLRREGYEFQIRKPEVIFKQENGVKLEPEEELWIDTPEGYIGTITTILSERKAVLMNMGTDHSQTRFVYKILTRNILGLRNQLLTATKGNVVINNFISGYVPVTSLKELYRKGALVSAFSGVVRGYALNTIQERGDLFIKAGTEVYEGMVIGINKYDRDLEVNPTKERHKSAHRIKHDEITQTKLKPIIPLTLEFALAFLNKDEILEVTPKNLRLRKSHLTHIEREWAKRGAKTDIAKKKLGLD